MHCCLGQWCLSLCLTIISTTVWVVVTDFFFCMRCSSLRSEGSSPRLTATVLASNQQLSLLVSEVCLLEFLLLSMIFQFWTAKMRMTCSTKPDLIRSMSLFQPFCPLLGEWMLSSEIPSCLRATEGTVLNLCNQFSDFSNF